MYFQKGSGKNRGGDFSTNDRDRYVANEENVNCVEGLKDSMLL